MKKKSENRDITEICFIVFSYFRGVPINEFRGLMPKMYSLIYDSNGVQQEKRTAKGIANSAIDKQLRHLHYTQCLCNNKVTLNQMNLIRSDNHILYVNNVRKTGPCNFDDKRFWKNSIQNYADISNHKKWCNVYY